MKEILERKLKVLKKKIKLLIKFQKTRKCFINSNGLIFISNYAKDFISEVVPIKNIPKSIIHHGISERFLNKKNLSKKI